MEVKNTKKRKRDTSEIIINNRGRLVAVQIQMYWLTLRMQERMTIDILLKLIFKSSSEITDEHQRIVESIFGELKVEEDIILPEKYSSSDESDEYQSRGNKKPKPKYSSELQGIKKVHVQGNRNYLFSSLDMITFDGSFCSYAQRQLVVDHINYNKDVYIDNIEAYFSKYVEKKLGNIMWKSNYLNSQTLLMFKLNFGAIHRFLNKALQTQYLIEKKTNVHFH